MIEFGPTQPKSVQIADVIRQRIRSGEYPPQSLISEVRMEAEFGVASATVRKVTAQLREEGLIVTTPGLGSFVAAVSSPNASEDAPALRPGRNRTPAEQGRKRGFAPRAKDRPHDRVRCACVARTKRAPCRSRTKTARAPPSFAVQNRAGFNPAGVDRVRAAGR
ncbi:GntR family transcriptional regulator [Streptomyces sp. NPDC055722]